MTESLNLDSQADVYIKHQRRKSLTITRISTALPKLDEGTQPPKSADTSPDETSSTSDIFLSPDKNHSWPERQIVIMPLDRGMGVCQPTISKCAYAQQASRNSLLLKISPSSCFPIGSSCLEAIKNFCCVGLGCLTI